MPEDSVDIDELGEALADTCFAVDVRHFASIGSTNTALLEAAADGAPAGTVYIADEQTSGRGRGGHAWHSAPGEGLYVSALLRPSLKLQQALLLSLATGVAAVEAVSETSGLAADLRWPNDLLLMRKDGMTRKCGGVLVETSVEPGDHPRLRYAVVGIGINVAHAGFPPELQDAATSLAMECGYGVSRPALLIALLRALDREVTCLEAGDAADLLQRFETHSTWVRGKRVSVPEQGGYTGVTAGLDAHGFLCVDSDDGVRRTVLSGGVRELVSQAPSAI